VTIYAYDHSSTQLVAVWETGVGAVAHPVARLHARTPVRNGVHLVKALSRLSEAAWLGYSDPGLVDAEPAEVLRALRRPHQPHAGLLFREGDPLLECANDAGRWLAAIGSAGVSRAVIADVAEELDCVERALRGDLSGRARQAVELTRLDVSPVQIVAADRLLYEVPMGSERLFTEVEPTAAAVAAAHWLQSAVDVTLEVTGWDDATAVLEAAEAIESFDITTPQVVLDLLRVGNPPIAAVQCLVRTAMLAARGMILHGSPDPTEDPADEARFTVLDPMHPARSLLERLTRAIQTCSLVHTEHLDPAVLITHPETDRMEAARQVFDAQVRVEAERTADRLLRTGSTDQAS
jgi:hypothetical protein